MDSQMDEQIEWREGPNQCPVNFFQVEGIKIFCSEISQYLRKMFFLFLTVTVIQCNVCFSTNIVSSKKRKYSHFLKDVYSYNYYRHFMFPLRLFRMDMDCTC